MGIELSWRRRWRRSHFLPQFLEVHEMRDLVRRVPHAVLFSAWGLIVVSLLVGLDQWLLSQHRQQALQEMSWEHRLLLREAQQALSPDSNRTPQAALTRMVQATQVQLAATERRQQRAPEQNCWLLLFSPSEQRLLDLRMVAGPAERNDIGREEAARDQLRRELWRLPEAMLETSAGSGSVRQAAVQSDLSQDAVHGQVEVAGDVWWITLMPLEDADLATGILTPLAVTQQRAAREHGPVRWGLAAIAACVFLGGFCFVGWRKDEPDDEPQPQPKETKPRTQATPAAANSSIALYESRNVRSREAVILGMAKLTETRGEGKGHHVDRVREYSRLIAEELREHYDRIDPLYVHNLMLAAALHDIGMVGVPEKIVRKPGPLLPDERQVINRHSTIGGDCLAALQEEAGSDEFLRMAFEIAYHHHERWDGLGYPSGLKEERIPLSARIVTLADVYDALTTERPYKRAFPHVQAVSIITDGSGRQFDPTVVQAFLNREDEFREIKERYGVGDDQELLERMAAIENFLHEGEQTVEGAARIVGSLE